MPEILVLVAHPNLRQSRVNARLMRAAQSTSPERITVRDLYALYPDYFIDVAAEQALLSEAQLVVWQHPLHWYGMPPLMKLWMDEVLSFGWAYGPGGQALRGKYLLPVLSTGGTEESYRSDGYNRFNFEAFLPPYEQTAALCGMRWLAPLVLHGAHRVSDAEIDGHALRYQERLSSFSEESARRLCQQLQTGAVPADERPLDAT